MAAEAEEPTRRWISSGIPWPLAPDSYPLGNPGADSITRTGASTRIGLGNGVATEKPTPDQGSMKWGALFNARW